MRCQHLTPRGEYPTNPGLVINPAIHASCQAADYSDSRRDCTVNSLLLWVFTLQIALEILIELAFSSIGEVFSWWLKDE